MNSSQPLIRNVSFSDVARGNHTNPGKNSLLISIVDPDMDHPMPAHTFAEVHKFKFLDIESSDLANNGDGTWSDMSEFAITDLQAQQLVAVLEHALENSMNVIVHCVAGVCRSGAVCEVGVMMGFEDTKAYRSPNLLVKHKMMRVLGWTYDEDEPHTINGEPVQPSEIFYKSL